MSTNNPFTSNLTKLYYKSERRFGIEQVQAPWQQLRIRTENLSRYTNNVVISNLSTPRSPNGFRYSEDVPVGSFTSLLSEYDLEELFSGVMRNNWNTVQLNQGEADTSFSFLLMNQNTKGDKFYTLFTGCSLTTVGFVFQVNSYVTFNFSLIANKVEIDFKPNPSATYKDSSITGLFIGRDAEINLNGEKVGNLSNFSGSFGYDILMQKVISLSNPFKKVVRGFACEGSIAGAFTDGSLVNQYIHETSFEIIVRLQYKKQVYEFIFPKTFVTELNYSSSGEGAIIQNTTIVSIYSPTKGSTVILKKARKENEL